MFTPRNGERAGPVLCARDTTQKSHPRYVLVRPSIPSVEEEVGAALQEAGLSDLEEGREAGAPLDAARPRHWDVPGGRHGE